ncbi:biotin--acetyl-CoA-carboxylase ligase [Methanococcus aeolicus Nankai-3]|uniref:Biotin--acetyl-CoA-carboxylase ligase n=1 Tax=Methanococcus aeolicus (strain ATCC BAA-1280 / DSM 17508 / OCM 812 / Nankai-3) TaxID=419665 RepID=A6UVT5_META3|nr:biotin--[acetyl-CoA-carboxylase] ligase [Methanococcus aeolicus]ABR56607.1 biotin--acetyl-CoA-carboxylase ligase [Methanococcus aeolicus Nankai-3]
MQINNKSNNKFKIIHLKTTISTNMDCIELGKEGKRNIVVVSDIQTKGKGRLNRLWYSNYGGLYFSMLLDIKDIKVEQINFMASLSIVDTLNNYSTKDFGTVGGQKPKVFGIVGRQKPKVFGIKFPNDIIVKNNHSTDYKKISGILGEINLNYGFVVVGIGININNTIDAEIKDIATSLKEIEGKEFNKQEILNVFINNFNKYKELTEKEILNKYKEYSATIGEKVKIITPNNEIIGIVQDIDFNGLYLKTDDNVIKNISVGDCIHLRKK